jgi:hypothetical protein
MPYITAERKDKVLPRYEMETPQNAGELNYILTETIFWYFKEHGGRYQQINDVLGALEGAKLEFYRRVAAPYEDKKIIENGDVY